MLSIDEINNLQEENKELKSKLKRLTKENIQLRGHLEGIRKEAKNSLQVGLMISSGWLEQKIDEVLDD